MHDYVMLRNETYEERAKIKGENERGKRLLDRSFNRRSNRGNGVKSNLNEF